MLKTIQIITLIQGLFLLVALIKKRAYYVKPTFHLLIGTIVSVILYILGSHETNLISYNIDIFLFDKSLFITFLFLFTKYHLSKSKSFIARDFLFFIPNLLFFIIELLEIMYSEGIHAIDIAEIFVELTFLTYMLLTLTLLIKSRANNWMLYFIIPLAGLIGFSILEEILYWFHIENTFFSLPNEHFGTYTIVIIAFLFYAITLKLIISPQDILMGNSKPKYKSSSLGNEQIETLKPKLIDLMETYELYKDPALSIQKISDTLGVPRQYISEVLNSHMQTSFQDFVNAYRVDAFIDCIKQKTYEHYTLLGIAKTVGFNSKTSFNTAFKKIKNMTPSEYRLLTVKTHN